MGTTAKRVSAVFLSTILSLALVEGILRIGAERSDYIRRACHVRPSVPEAYLRMQSVEELVGSVVIPPQPYSVWNHFLLNSKGFRTPEYKVEKPQGTFRVVVLGDSFVFDSGPTPWLQHFTMRLKVGLAARLKQPVELISMGIPGAGPLLESRLLEIEALRLKPDLILWAFFVGNDFTDEFARESQKRLGIDLRSLLDRPLYLRLHLGRLLAPLLYARSYPTRPLMGPSPLGTQGGVPLDGPMPPPAERSSTFDRNQYLGLVNTFTQICQREQFPQANFEEIQRAIRRSLAKLRRAKTPLLFLIIPEESQVDDALHAEVLAHFNEREDDYDRSQPQRFLSTFLAKEGVAFLDLLARMRTEGKGKSLYHHNDSHWNIDGNRVAAAALLERLTEALGPPPNRFDGLVPAGPPR